MINLQKDIAELFSYKIKINIRITNKNTTRKTIPSLLLSVC